MQADVCMSPLTQPGKSDTKLDAKASTASNDIAWPTGNVIKCPYESPSYTKKYSLQQWVQEMSCSSSTILVTSHGRKSVTSDEPKLWKYRDLEA